MISNDVLVHITHLCWSAGMGLSGGPHMGYLGKLSSGAHSIWVYSISGLRAGQNPKCVCVNAGLTTNTYTKFADIEKLKAMLSKNSYEKGKTDKESVVENAVTPQTPAQEASKNRTSKASLPGHANERKLQCPGFKKHLLLLPLFLCCLELCPKSYRLPNSNVLYCPKLTIVGKSHPTP